MSEYNFGQDVRKFAPLYVRHVVAMTEEGLHDKTDIAAELAWHDFIIAELGKNLVEVVEKVNLLLKLDINENTNA